MPRYTQDFFLQKLAISPVCLRTRPYKGLALPEADRRIADYFAAHPRSTISALREAVPQIGAAAYDMTRAQVRALLQAGVLEIAGQVPLPEVDLRYEPVAVCAVCQAPGAGQPTVLWRHNTPVVRCTGCGLWYSNPRWKVEHLFGSYNAEYWGEYPPDRAPDDPALAHWHWRLDQIAPLCPTGRLLDIGAATGEFLDVAAARGWEAYGVEPSAPGAERAARKHPGRIHAGVLETAPWAAGWFDVVTLWDVIEHIPDPRAYVQQIARLLRPGGVFAITTPNMRSLAYRLIGPRWSAIIPNTHIYYFAPRTLARLLQATGFAIHSQQTFGTAPEVWETWLPYPPLARIQEALARFSRPASDRLLLGDELLALARRRPGRSAGS